MAWRCTPRSYGSKDEGLIPSRLIVVCLLNRVVEDVLPASDNTAWLGR